MGLKLTMSKKISCKHPVQDFGFSSSISQATSTGASVNDTCSQETPRIWKVSTPISEPKYFISLPMHTCFQIATNK